MLIAALIFTYLFAAFGFMWVDRNYHADVSWRTDLLCLLWLPLLVYGAVCFARDRIEIRRDIRKHRRFAKLLRS